MTTVTTTPKDYTKKLYYYNGYTSNTTAEAMLADPTGNGQCHAWADLLIECWKANNLPDVAIVRVDDPTTNNIDGFVVKNITFGTPSHPGDAPWKYVEGDITFTTTGIAGQNMSTPSYKDFGLHYVCHQTGSYEYYDPSYGTTVSGATLNEARGNWRDQALDAWRNDSGYPQRRYSKISDLPTDLPVFTDGW